MLDSNMKEDLNHFTYLLVYVGFTWKSNIKIRYVLSEWLMKAAKPESREEDVINALKRRKYNVIDAPFYYINS